MQKKIWIFLTPILVIILAVSAILFWQNSQKLKEQEDYGSVKVTQIDTNVDNSSSSSIEGDPNRNQNNENSPTQSNNSKFNLESGYTSYSQEKLKNAEFGKVVLFFHASWCPSCKALDTDIKANIDKIPNDLLILKVDYDSNPELKIKYKITSQHTLVSVTKNGELIKSSAGLYQLNTLESVIKEF